MTQEEKLLLIKDLCARLPYGVRGKVKADTVVPHKYDIDGFPLETTFDVDVELQRIDIGNDEIFVFTFDNNENLGTYIEECQIEGSPWTIEEFKPYLRPISSMTEEEKREFPFPYYFEWIDSNFSLLCSNDKVCASIGFDEMYEIIDWLNKHHFDYRGFIEKGLALEAPKNMYKFD